MSDYQSMSGGGDGAARSARYVLGIDPGLRVCGWGVVEAGKPPRFIDCGTIRPSPRDTLPQRLLALEDGVAGLIRRFSPSEVAIERPFIGSVAPAAALAIGQAQAAAVLAAAGAGLDVSFYAPAAVKLAVAGYGQSEKRQIQAVVRLLLNLEAPPTPADAADALAVALCHIQQTLVRALSTGNG